MITKKVLQKLIKFNLWIVVAFYLILVGSILAANGLKALNVALIDSFKIVVVLLINAITNLALFVLFSRGKKKNALQLKILFHALSYVINVSSYLIFSIFFSRMASVEINFFMYLFWCFYGFVMNTLILILDNYVVIQELKAKIELENTKLKAANADASNQLLRQQIHPHFLFNSLNTIKSLYKKDNDLGNKYIIHLSDFLRVVVSDNNKKVNKLMSELKLCEDYIEMQKIRFKKALVFKVSITDEALKDGYLPSFALQPLVENAIKHNELTEEKPLFIQVNQVNDRIEISNNLQEKKSNEGSTGSGLVNLSERYRLISNEEVIINQTEQNFSVSIKILGDEYSNN